MKVNVTVNRIIWSKIFGKLFKYWCCLLKVREKHQSLHKLFLFQMEWCMDIYQLAIMSNCHFVYLAFHKNDIDQTGDFITMVFNQISILSSWHFINFCQLAFHQLDISSNWRFINLTFQQHFISSNWHFINLTFHLLDILSTWHFINLTFHQLDILAT